MRANEHVRICVVVRCELNKQATSKNSMIACTCACVWAKGDERRMGCVHICEGCGKTECLTNSRIEGRQRNGKMTCVFVSRDAVVNRLALDFGVVAHLCRDETRPVVSHAVAARCMGRGQCKIGDRRTARGGLARVMSQSGRSNTDAFGAV
jgi:hypothetical protein